MDYRVVLGIRSEPIVFPRSPTPLPYKEKDNTVYKKVDKLPVSYPICGNSSHIQRKL